MSNRLYRLIAGLALLTGLYFDLPAVIYALIAVVLFEGITNLRIPVIISEMRNTAGDENEGTLGLSLHPRFNFDAERAWRLVLGSVLILVYVIFFDEVWYLAWFMGFAILGAGLSGVCPLFISLKYLGFR
ncbi:MAG: DUF2892 domain-containing protein [Pseudomonadota bacterium]|nr:DUF2892 domain-containing protein [Pseudomonadota bacterium]